jgi:chorismate dehydratase
MKTVGCVPYINARPLVHLLDKPASPVRVQYEIPSVLAAQLREGAVDAALVSSWMALTEPGWRAACGVGIVSDGPVESVRVFAKRPLDEIESIALDRASLTSNHLALLLLKELHGRSPVAEPMQPDIDSMLDVHDACVLIGDQGMEASSEGLHVLDLGAAWKDLTGLPFVWALWIGGSRLDGELSFWLSALAKAGGFVECPTCPHIELAANIIGDVNQMVGDRRAQQREEIIAHAAAESGWDVERVRKYLGGSILFHVGERELEGLALYGKLLAESGVSNAVHMPEMIEAVVPRHLSPIDPASSPSAG